MEKQKRIALVTGGNKGIGFEICRQLGRAGYSVLLGARSPSKGEAAAKKLADEGLDVQFLKLDVTVDVDMFSAHEFVASRFGRLDVLVNNAGIYLDDGFSAPVFEAKIETIEETFRTNTLAPFRLCQLFVPMMIQQGYGRVVNISSGMGQLGEMDGGAPAYRISKTALNAVTRIFAAETRGRDVLINSACPGWVKTDMGGSGAELTVQEGADTPVWLATLPKGGPNGGFFRERERIEW